MILSFYLLAKQEYLHKAWKEYNTRQPFRLPNLRLPQKDNSHFYENLRS